MNVTNIFGRHSIAKVYTSNIETEAREQLRILCDQPFSANANIRIMPDVHAGKGCVIGFTANLGQLVIPNIVGVDIGCGVLTVCLGNMDIDYAALDTIIRTQVPSGFHIHEAPIEEFAAIEQLHCYPFLANVGRFHRSLGTLGGGNHFIEIAQDEDDNKYLLIHTGSRNLGKQVADHYQKMAVALCEEQRVDGLPKTLCYLEGDARQAYLDDMHICQLFAQANRRLIANTITLALCNQALIQFENFETVHNYIDHKRNIIRKGAVSADIGEPLIIPINMRDGSLLCMGRGNPDWNFSAPHGAGRLLSRTTARKTFAMDDYVASMDGIYTSSVNEQTIDECPMAYKPIEDIKDNIEPTVHILAQLRPTYNFKAN